MDGLVYYDPDELRTKDFNKFIDQLLETGTVDDELWTSLTIVQRDCYSVINRSFARIKRRSSEKT